MRHILFFIFIFCTNLAVAKNESDSLISVLNKELEKKQHYMDMKGKEIQKLKNLLEMPDLSLLQEYDINTRLYRQYQKYKLDSATYFVERNLDIAGLLNNSDLKTAAEIQLAVLYSASGMYIESERILKNIDRKSLSRDLLASYFKAYSEFYGHYAQSNGKQTYFPNESYRDSLFAILPPNSVKYELTYIESILFQGQVDIAEKRLLQLMDIVEEENEDFAFITYLMGMVYGQKHNVDLQKKYYAMSAIADVRNAIKDNASLQSLALIFYEEGNIDQAYKYTKAAIEDAVFSNVRFRTIGISEFYSIINTSYQAKESKRKSELQTYLLLISILSVFLIAAVIYVYKQMKRLSRIRKELYHTNVKLTNLNQDIIDRNEQLNEVNAQLSESNHIKEEYIAHFFDLCSDYIDKLENYRKSLGKKAANNQLDELFRMLKSTTMVDNEVEELYKNFDTVFLNLYPTFVEDFNALLAEDEKIYPKQGELLNTELRIFALIRLGITDSVKIAGFLRYSLRTVYNYRTKVRNKAAGSRDDFEAMVKKIGAYQRKNEDDLT